LISPRDIIIPVKVDENIEIKIKKPLYDIVAPVKLGEKVGRVEVYSNGKLMFTEALVAKNFVIRKNIFKEKLDDIVKFVIPNK